MGSILARIGGMLGSPAGTPPIDDVTDAILAQISAIVWPIMTVLAGIAVLYSIWLGVQLATAQDESKRKEAKARLVWAIVAVVLCLGLTAIFLAIANVM
ncbi:MAG: pilin [Firmicutes bacterium]|nr:pilin [Bacillota bacterium]